MATPVEPTPAEQDPRVYLAAERTLLAWVRTGLALMGFGFVVARFGLFLREMATLRGDVETPATTGRGSLWFGLLLIAAGVFVNAAAAIDHARIVRSLRRGDSHPATKSAMAVVLGAALALLGGVMGVYLLRAGW